MPVLKSPGSCQKSNSQALTPLMLFKQKRFSETGNQSDNLSKVQGELDELKGIMVKNIGKCLIVCSSHFRKLGRHYFRALISIIIISFCFSYIC